MKLLSNEITLSNSTFHVIVGLGAFDGKCRLGSICDSVNRRVPESTGDRPTFMISVTASPDVVQATATVDLHPGVPRTLQVPLAKQGSAWVGSSFMPADPRLQLPGAAGAMVTVTLFDGSNHRSVGVVHVGLSIVSLTAVFSGGDVPSPGMITTIRSSSVATWRERFW